MSTVRATVCSLTGESVLQLDVDVGSPVAALKAEVAQVWCFPATFLELVHSNRVVDDDELVDQTSYQLVTTLASLYRDLENPYVHIRSKALSQLAELGLKGGGGALAAAMKCLDDQDANVRLMAVRAVADLASLQTQREALSALASSMLDNESAVRSAATLALADVSSQGDMVCIENLVERLLDKCCMVRGSAIQALCRVAGRGHSQGLALVIPYLRHEHAFVRQEAVTAVAKLAKPGDPEAIAHLIERLGDKDRVKWEAVEGLAELALKGDKKVVLALAASAGNGPWYGTIQEATLLALTQVADPGDADAITAIQGGLASWDEDIRILSVEGLGKLVRKEDEKAMRVLCGCLKDRAATVREAAREALWQIGLARKDTME